MPDDRDILNPRDAAALLGMHEETVRRLAREGKVPAYKVGGGWRFSRNMLDEWGRSQVGRRRQQILLVDDEALFRTMIIEALTAAGYGVEAFGDGRDALAWLESNTPAVVLLDLMMPGISGPEVLAAIRGRHGALPVIIVTGHPDSDLMAEVLRYSPVTVISKPLKIETLREAVALLAGEPQGRERHGHDSGSR